MGGYWGDTSGGSTPISVGRTGPGYAGATASTLGLSVGSKTFGVQTGLAFIPGLRVRLAYDATRWMEGEITAYSGTSMTVLIDGVEGSGTFANWKLSVTGNTAETLDAAQRAEDAAAQVATDRTAVAADRVTTVDAKDVAVAAKDTTVAQTIIATQKADAASISETNSGANAAAASADRILADAAAALGLGYSNSAARDAASVLAAVADLAPSATIDTTNADNISTGILAVDRLAAGSITADKLAAGAVSTSLGYTPLAPSGSGAALTGLTKSQVGLSAVDNTSDASKPVSSAQAAAISAVSAKLPSAQYATAASVPAGGPPYQLSAIIWGARQRALAINIPGVGVVPTDSGLVRGVDVNGIQIGGFPAGLSGLDIQYNGGALILQPGTWHAGKPWHAFAFDANIPFNPMTTVGLNGMDADYGSPPADAHYYAYLLGKEATPWNDTRIVLSQAITITSVRSNLNANVPGSSSYDYIRKLPYAMRVYGGAILPYAMEGGWPYPTYRYTGADSVDAKWVMLSAGASTSEVITSLATWVPDNARTIEVVMEVTSGGTAGDAYIRTPGVPGTGESIWVSAVSGDKRSRLAVLRTDSSRNVIYKVPAGATLKLSIRAVKVSEQTL